LNSAELHSIRIKLLLLSIESDSRSAGKVMFRNYIKQNNFDLEKEVHFFYSEQIAAMKHRIFPFHWSL
jgi:hypothetical protein